MAQYLNLATLFDYCRISDHKIHLSNLSRLNCQSSTVTAKSQSFFTFQYYEISLQLGDNLSYWPKQLQPGRITHCMVKITNVGLYYILSIDHKILMGHNSFEVKASLSFERPHRNFSVQGVTNLLLQTSTIIPDKIHRLRPEQKFQFVNLINVIFDQAQVAEGGQLEDPAIYM